MNWRFLRWEFFEESFWKSWFHQLCDSHFVPALLSNGILEGGCDTRDKQEIREHKDTITHHVRVLCLHWVYFFHGLLWGSFGSQRLVVITACWLVQRCTFSPQWIHVFTMLWRYYASPVFHKSPPPPLHWLISWCSSADWQIQWALHGKICARLDFLSRWKHERLVEQVLSWVDVCATKTTSIW